MAGTAYRRGSRWGRPRAGRAVLLAGAVLAAALGVPAAPATAATGCSVSYTVTSQWPGGFVASVALTNLGDALTSWTLTWTMTSGEQVTTAWNATVAQSGARVSAVNAAWNGALATGGTATFGLQGAATSTGPIADAALNGTACTGAVTGSTTTTTTTTTTSRPTTTTTTSPPTTTTSRPTTTTTTTTTTSRPTTTTTTTTTTSRPTTTTTTTGSGSTSTWETVIDSSAFSSYTALESAFAYQYPWGSDHNGSARMYGSATDHNHVYLEDGQLVLKASRITWDEGTSTASPYPVIHYHSGAVHAKEHVVVNDTYPNWEVKGQFQAPGAAGTWPAFWLTGVNSWPPEIDILEFKGNAQNWFNTFRSSSDVSSTIVPVSNPGTTWHEYRAWITKVSATDVDVHFYVDGVWKGVHHATGFVGKPLWLIMNLQMEGSSGSSGPTSDTYYRSRDVYVGRSHVS